jgi:hypothetical protein
VRDARYPTFPRHIIVFRHISRLMSIHDALFCYARLDICHSLTIPSFAASCSPFDGPSRSACLMRAAQYSWRAPHTMVYTKPLEARSKSSLDIPACSAWEPVCLGQPACWLGGQTVYCLTSTQNQWVRTARAALTVGRTCEKFVRRLLLPLTQPDATMMLL